MSEEQSFTVEAVLKANDAGFSKGFKAAESSVTGFANKVSGVGSLFSQVLGANVIGSAITSGIGAVSNAIGQTVSSAIDAGAKLEQSMGGVETLYQGAVNEVKQYAAEAAKAGISANSFAEQAVSFGATLKQSLGGDSVAAAKMANMAIMDMADNAAKMGTSIETVQQTYQSLARGNYQMLDSLKLGYGGTKSEMERLLADAEKLPQAMGRKFDLTNFADVATAIHIVQENLGVAGVAAAEASTTFSGSSEAMKASWANVLGAITSGELDITPQLENLASSTSAFLFNNFIPMVGRVMKALPSAIGTFISVAGETLGPQMMELGKTLIGGLSSGFSGNISQIFTGLSQITNTATEWVMTTLPTFLNAGVEFVSNIVTGFLQGLPTAISGLGEFITSTVIFLASASLQFLEAGAKFVLSLIDGIIQNLPSIVQTAAQTIVSFITTLGEKGPELISKGFELLGDFISGILQRLPSLVATALKTVVEFGATILLNLPTILKAGGEILLSLVKGVLNLIGKVFEATQKIGKELGDGVKKIDLFAAGKAIMDGFLKGLKSMWDSITGFVGDIAGWIKDHKGPISYDKVLLIPAGRAIMGGFHKSLVDNFKDVRSMITDVAPTLQKIMDKSELETPKVDVTPFRESIKGLLDNDLGYSIDVGRLSAQSEITYRRDDEAQISVMKDTLKAIKDLIGRDVVVSVDGRELARTIGDDMTEYQDEKEKFENMLWGLT